MRVGIFGGSFDPVHLGHLWIAEMTREAIGLDEVWFVPAATSPLKPNGPVATDAQRVGMLRLAIAGNPSLRVDMREIERGGISYTIDTVEQLRRENPDHDWFILIGTDAFNTLDQWHRPGELLTIATPVVLRRGGDRDPDWELIARLAGVERMKAIRESTVRLPLIEISSSEIRNRVAAGLSIRYRMPAAVTAMIDAEKIYQ